MDEATAVGNFGLAVNLGKLAVAEATHGHAAELARRAKDCLADLQNTDKLVADLEAAKTKLTETPDDPAANLTVGSYYCYYQGNWTKGLPLLAKGSDSSLKALAAREVAWPAKAEDQMALADGWWDQAQNAEGFAKLAAWRHAGNWYAKCQARLPSGLAKVKVEKRLDELAKVEGETAGAATASATSHFTTKLNKWFPLLTSPNELIGWEVGDCRFSYTNGLIELQENFLFCPIVTKDVAIRARMKRTSGAQCVLSCAIPMPGAMPRCSKAGP